MIGQIFEVLFTTKSQITTYSLIAEQVSTPNIVVESRSRQVNVVVENELFALRILMQIT